MQGEPEWLTAREMVEGGPEQEMEPAHLHGEGEMGWGAEKADAFYPPKPARSSVWMSLTYTAFPAQGVVNLK